MFALEISFQDGVSEPEMIFVRRQSVLIGASESAHIEVQDMRPLSYELRLIRDLGRRFRCLPVPSAKGVQVPQFLEGVYEDQAVLDLGPVKFNIIALDSDLPIKESETPDRAGVRVLRQASSTPAPLFPAIVISGSNPIVMSFVPDSPVYLGSSKQCALRIDMPEISARHARIGYESGEFWVEDLGSTNGTFVNNSQISGRVNVPVATPISIGRILTIMGVTSEDQIQRAVSVVPEKAVKAAAGERRYPILISVSEVARPARLVMPIDAVMNVGRDPASDIWLGAPHVSRRHCSLSLSKTGQVAISDHSTNGTAYDEGILRRGDVVQLNKDAKVLDFGGGVTLAICFDDEQEKRFVTSGGDPKTFKGSSHEVSEEVMVYQPAREMRSRAHKMVAGPEKKLSWKDSLKRLLLMYHSLGTRSKMVLCLTAVGLTVILVIVFHLIARISF